VLLLNTCSIREKAQEKVFHVLGRWKLLKRKNPDLIIGVGGCVASQEGKLIRQRAPMWIFLWPADPAPPAGDDQSGSRQPQPGR
jgi:tRNA A37 methylthiotransferase MiaB